MEINFFSLIVLVLLPWPFVPRCWLEIPRRDRHFGSQAQGQGRGLLQEETGRREGQAGGPERSQVGQEGGALPEGRRGLRLRLKCLSILGVTIY